jgi:phosphatidylglycerol:prolipoprotein diacylglycerol transferase
MPVDVHDLPTVWTGAWGILPAVQIWGLSLPMYTLLVGLGLVAGAAWYFLSLRGTVRTKGNGLVIFIAAFGGSTLGAKLPMLVAHWAQLAPGGNLAVLLDSGRTVVGGLIGGALGVWVVKKALGITQRLGNHIAPAAALGIGIGRLGCFCAGCCYGQPTGVPGFGVDFGDGVLRHPTQLYEAGWDWLLFAFLLVLNQRVRIPGANFRIFVILYLGMRFFLEFIRVEPRLVLGLTGFQLASGPAVGLAVFSLARLWRQRAGANVQAD